MEQQTAGERLVELENQAAALIAELDRLEAQPEPRSVEHTRAIEAAREAIIDWEEEHDDEVAELKTALST